MIDIRDTVQSWAGFVVGMAVFIATATGLDYGGTRSTARARPQILESLQFAVELLLLALTVSALLWLCVRLARGKNSAPALKTPCCGTRVSSVRSRWRCA